MLQTDGLIPHYEYEWFVQHAATMRDTDQQYSAVKTVGIYALTFALEMGGMVLAADASRTHYLYYNNPMCDTPAIEEQAQLKDMLQQYTRMDLSQEVAIDDNYSTAQDTYYREVGAVYGVTVPGYRVEFADLFDDLWNNGEGEWPAGRQYLDRVNIWLEQYGVRFAVEAPDIDAEDSVKPLTEEELNSQEFKEALYNTVSVIGIWPTEFINELPFDTIVYQRGMPDNQENALAYADYAKRRIVLNSGTKDVIAHELSHFIDGRIGCSMPGGHDPKWAELTPSFTYTRQGWQLAGQTVADVSTQSDDFALQRRELIKTITTTTSDGDAAALEQLDQHFEYSQRIAFNTPYATTSPTEDKAEILMDLQTLIISGDQRSELSALSALHKPLLSKSLTWLHRINHVSPETAGYLADILPSVKEKSDYWYYSPGKWSLVRSQLSDADESA